MPKPKKTLEEKLEDQIKIMADKSGKHIIGNLESNGLGLMQSDLAYDPHTLLKLAYLNYYLGVFLPIAGYRKDKGKFDKIVFIDAFGGSGIVGIKNSRYSVLGSTLLAATANARGRVFDEVISIDIDNARSDILDKRCKSLGLTNVSVLRGDVNNLIQSVSATFNISSNSIVMLFIDPEGMEPEFSKFLALSDTTHYLDIMLNYTFGVRRLNGRIEYNHASADIQKMKSMIPTWVPGTDPDERLAYFFESQFGKPKSRETKIHSKGQKEEYSVILRVRETWGNSSWLDAMNDFGDFVSQIDGDRALTSLRVIMGDQARLFP